MYLDENGNPSERSGPDLAKAEPIEAVIKRLAPMRNGYAAAFINAAEASGIDVSIMRTREGEDRLMLGFPFDTQEQLRRPRFVALCAQLKRGKFRRNAVIDLVNLLGRFVDNQPYDTLEEAADAYAGAGGRIMIGPDGQCEEMIPYNEERFRAESWNGFELRRLAQRYDATLCMRGGRGAMAALVLEKGKVHAGTGWTVLQGGVGQ
jgi:hypothetical protein